MPESGAFELFAEILTVLESRRLTLDAAETELRHIASLHPDGLYPDDVLDSFANRHDLDPNEKKLVHELLGFLVHRGRLTRQGGRITAPVEPPHVVALVRVPLHTWPSVSHYAHAGNAWIAGPTDGA